MSTVLQPWTSSLAPSPTSIVVNCAQHPVRSCLQSQILGLRSGAGGYPRTTHSSACIAPSSVSPHLRRHMRLALRSAGNGVPITRKCSKNPSAPSPAPRFKTALRNLFQFQALVVNLN